jgi:hypothetical protein
MSDFPGRVTRLAQLHAKLVIARIQADNPDDGVNPIFLGAVKQLVALIEFVESDPQCRRLVPELHELHRAIVNADRGLPTDWLMPRPRPGARALEVITAERRGRYAAVMEYLMRAAGFTEKEAANFIIKEGSLRRELPKRANAAPDWRVIYNWRQRAIGQPDPSHAAEQGAFKAMLALIDNRSDPKADPKTVAREMLRALNVVRRGKPI